MKKERALNVIREIAEREIAADVDLWPRVERELVPEQRSTRRILTRPVPRLSWIAAILVVLFLFGAAAYATSPAGRALLGLDSGLERVDLAGLGRELNLEQTKKGSTVILHWAYADANRLAVAYEIAGAGGRRYDARDITLTDDDGNVYQGTIGMGIIGESELVDVVLPPGGSAYIYSFDASPISGSPDMVDLQLSLSLEAFELPAEAQATVTVLESEGGTATVVELEPLQEREREVVGPFVFDFSVPFVPGRMAEPGMTVDSEGIPVTLEKVVAAPSETVALICIENPDQTGYDEWLPISEIAVTGERRQAMAGSHTGVDDNCTLSRYELPLSGAGAGVWTLTVTEVVGFKSTEPGQMRVEGPWVFEFTLAP